jgi:DHA2 family multidrug resistance protein-like MFS transporter
MLGTARLLGQSLGAAAVAILFRVYSERGANIALFIAAGVALAAAGVSLSRLIGGSTKPEGAEREAAV